MHIKKESIKVIENINEQIDNSYNGTCFAYDFFLKLKKSKYLLSIYDDKDILQGFMPLFSCESKRKIKQSTMYIPYGGPIIFSLPKEERNKIRYIREIEKALCKYFVENFDEVNFSTDVKIKDIMPFIRSGFTPEVRYTYRIDLRKNIEKVYEEFGSDRKKDIRKAIKRNIKFLIDDGKEYFDCKKAMKWEKKYGFESSYKFTEKYILETLKNKKGMCFVAMEDEKVIGGVHIAWDKKTAYILYSFYENVKDDVAIAFIYYKMFEYLINNKLVDFIDFEGSVFESIENFNISFGAFQERFYNLHWNKKNEPYLNIYDYGEK